MRELEMRQRVERFLQSRLAKMLMPATLGLGLAVGGCGSNALEAGHDSAVTVEASTSGGPAGDAQLPPDMGSGHDLGGISMKYMAQTPDAGRDVGGPIALYMAPNPIPDGGAVMRYMAPQPVDAGSDGERGVVAIYMAQLPVSRT